MAFNFYKGPQKIDDIISQTDIDGDTKIDTGNNQIDLVISGSTLLSLKPKNAEITGSLIINGPASPNYALRIVSGDLELADGIRLEAGSSGQFLMFNSGGNSQLQAVSGHMLFKVSSTRRYEFDFGGSGSTDIFRIRDNAANVKFVVDGAGSTQVTGNLGVTNSITASVGINMAGSSLETSWTPYSVQWTTQAAPQPVIGNGTLVGYYKQIGKTVFVRVKMTAGTTTTFGTGPFLFSLPVSASNADGIQFPCSMLDNGLAWYQGIVNGTYSGFTEKTAIIALSPGGYNSSEAVTSVHPITWGSTDSLMFNGSYESI